MKVATVSSCVLMIAGATTVAGFLLASGLQYRALEERGLEPGHTPDPIGLGINLGLCGFGCGLLILAVAGVTGLIQRR